MSSSCITWVGSSRSQPARRSRSSMICRRVSASEYGSGFMPPSSFSRSRPPPQKRLHIPRLDPPLLPRLEVEQVELGHARLRQPERHPDSKREALDRSARHTTEI